LAQRDNYFEYGQLIYTLDKLPYHVDAQYRPNSDVTQVLVVQIDLIFDQFVLFVIDYLLVRVLGGWLLLYDEIDV
jgi:hypothetical protein